MSSIQFTVFKRPLNQIEEIKNIRIEKKIECYIFERVRLSSVIKRSGALYRKTRMEQNRSIDPALKQPRRFEVLFLSLQSNLYVTALY